MTSYALDAPKRCTSLHFKKCSQMQPLTNAGLRLNDKKCQFRKSSRRFLSHLVSAKGIEPDTVKAIAQAPAPHDAGTLRLSHCVPSFADFKWTDAADNRSGSWNSCGLLPCQASFLQRLWLWRRCRLHADTTLNAQSHLLQEHCQRPKENLQQLKRRPYCTFTPKAVKYAKS